MQGHNEVDGKDQSGTTNQHKSRNSEMGIVSPILTADAARTVDTCAPAGLTSAAEEYFMKNKAVCRLKVPTLIATLLALAWACTAGPRGYTQFEVTIDPPLRGEAAARRALLLLSRTEKF